MASAVWTPKAETDLEEVLYYIRVNSERPLTARRIGAEIVAAANHQAELPGTGMRYLAAPDSWLYVRHKRWLVFYQPHSEGIEVMRVVDGSRDLPSALAEGTHPG